MIGSAWKSGQRDVAAMSIPTRGCGIRGHARCHALPADNPPTNSAATRVGPARQMVVKEGKRAERRVALKKALNVGKSDITLRLAS